MLDENLPTFYLRSSSDGIKHNASVQLSQHGSEATPAYFLRHPDPALPASKNRYAAALYDSYNPEILFGEVLLIPEWSQSPTKEETRANGGIPSPPQPISPTEFVIQLYNPDQQVHVKWHPGTWTSAPYWDFDIPQQSFRQPSTSKLDHSQSDPTATATTPKLCFRWKKDGKLSKDYVCSLSDKSSNPEGGKRKHKEPDITMALFRNFKEITIYEPNLTRIDIEDPKGFEVVMILGAVVIREVFNCNLREAFNISDVSGVVAAAGGVSNLVPQSPQRRHRHSVSGVVPSNNLSPVSSSSHQQPPVSAQLPPMDPRTQWELDAEEARLKKQVEREERERRRADAAETERVKKMLKDEERRARERQKEIDRETERLKKIYGREEKQSLAQLKTRPPALPNRHSYQPTPQIQTSVLPVTAFPPAPVQRPHSAAPSPYIASNLQPYPNQPQGSFLSPYGAPQPPSGDLNGHAHPESSNTHTVAPKKSFWRMKGGNDEGNRLTKQKSTVF